MANYKKQNQQTVLEVIVIGIFKAIAAIFRLIFKGVGKKSKLSNEEVNQIRRKRHEIESMLKSNNVHELRQAVFEADKLVDYVLKAKNYPGETFADRLKSAREYIDHTLYDQIWQGHKVRNQLAHESESRITGYELRSAAEKLLRYVGTI